MPSEIQERGEPRRESQGAGGVGEAEREARSKAPLESLARLLARRAVGRLEAQGCFGVGEERGESTLRAWGLDCGVRIQLRACLPFAQEPDRMKLDCDVWIRPELPGRRDVDAPPWGLTGLGMGVALAPTSNPEVGSAIVAPGRESWRGACGICQRPMDPESSAKLAELAVELFGEALLGARQNLESSTAFARALAAAQAEELDAALGAGGEPADRADRSLRL